MSENRVALVTGATGGLGRAVALELARTGWNLVLVARPEEELDALAREIRRLDRHPLVRRTDVTRSGELQAVAIAVESRFGRLDLLVNHAGVEQHASTETLQEEGIDGPVLIHPTSVFLALQAFLPLLARTPGASIVSMASAAGLAGMPLAAAYGATKAAVLHLTRALAAEWRRHGVRINCVCPGLIDSDLAHRGLESFRRSGFPVDLLTARRGKPEEFVRAVAFLASVEAPFVDDPALAAPGGATLR